MDDRQPPEREVSASAEPEPDATPSEGPEAPEVGPQAARAHPEPPSVDMPLVRPASSDLGGPDWRRWRLYGCAAAFLGLVALLVLGANILRNTVWLGYGSTHQRVVAALGNASPPERMRTIRNLNAFTARLRAMDDPYGLMGAFQRHAGEALADGRLDPAELDELNAFLEQPDGTESR